jgi:hypothetical protein
MKHVQASIARHLTAAGRDIRAGERSFRSAAEHIAEAVALGATQATIAEAVGKSQSWISQLLKWRKGAYQGISPFADAHAKAKIISAANNLTIEHGKPNTKYLTAEVVHRSEELVCPAYVKTGESRPLSETSNFPNGGGETVVPLRPGLELTASQRRRQLATTMEYLLRPFDGHVAAMWAAIDHYRLETSVVETKEQVTHTH